MIRLVFLVEEPSMRALLHALLPRFELSIEPFVLVFPGKDGLEKQAPHRMRDFQDAPGIEPRFIIVRDNDGADCAKVKARIVERCRDVRHPFLVRIVMQELESWFFGDLAAVAAAYDQPKLALLDRTKRYRDPDLISRPSNELRELTGNGRKIERAGEIALHMSLAENRSRSFQVFCEGVRKLAELPRV